MTLSTETVREVAKLARLELTEAEVELFTRQLNDILNYFNKLNELDTGGIPPMSHVLAGHNVFREDRVQQSLEVEEALANAPVRQHHFFQVPRII